MHRAGRPAAFHAQKRALPAGVEGGASTLAASAQVVPGTGVFTALLAFLSDHPLATGTFALIIGWASLEGPNANSRGLFREALKLAGGAFFLYLFTVCLYGEFAEPGYVNRELGGLAVSALSYAQANTAELLFSAGSFLAVLVLPAPVSAPVVFVAWAALSYYQGVPLPDFLGKAAEVRGVVGAAPGGGAAS